MSKQLTAIIEKEDDGYVAFCPEVNIVSRGDMTGEPRANLKEALEAAVMHYVENFYHFSPF